MLRPTVRAGRCRRAGFTLIEAALVTIIVGVGVTAMMALMAAGTLGNDSAAQLTTAINLANQIHELTERMTFTDANYDWGMPNGQTISTVTFITGLDGQTFDGSNSTGPIEGATRTVIPELSNWAQSVQVQSVYSNNITSSPPSNSAKNYPMARVTVTIKHNGNTVYKTSWLAVNAS